MEGNTPYWMPLLKPSHKPDDYLVYGPEVSGRIGGKCSCWFWDCLAWWAEDGTELASLDQLSGAHWDNLPPYP